MPSILLLTAALALLCAPPAAVPRPSVLVAPQPSPAGFGQLSSSGFGQLSLSRFGQPLPAWFGQPLPGRVDELSPAGFGWPVTPGRVVRRFDPPPRPWLAGHRGVDLAGSPSAVVHSAGAGTVIYAGVIAGRGVVSVAHPGGLRTTYEPVTPSVAVGAAVDRGGGLGTLEAGHPGCPEPACLHWGLRRGDAYLDPLVLLGLGRVRLLPLVGQP